MDWQRTGPGRFSSVVRGSFKEDHYDRVLGQGSKILLMGENSSVQTWRHPLLRGLSWKRMGLWVPDMRTTVYDFGMEIVRGNVFLVVFTLVFREGL